MSKPKNKTNADLVDLIDQLKTKSRDTGAALARCGSAALQSRSLGTAQPEPVSRYAPEGDRRGAGQVARFWRRCRRTHHRRLQCCAGARAKVEAAGGRVMSLELMDENPKDQGWLSPEATTYVYDADGAILGRSSAVADLLPEGGPRQSGGQGRHRQR